MKCDELKWNWVYYPYLDAPNEQEESALKAGYIKVMDKSEVDAAIAELKEKLMPCLNGDCILTCEVVEKYGKENAELKAKLEDVQASAYAESVDAGMRERRLKRALWLARAERASDKALIFYFAMTESYPLNINGYSGEEKGHTRMRNAIWWRTTWLKVERKCLKKAKEYK